MPTPQAQVIRTGRAEESLRREKAFADIVIDSIPGVFYVLDSQGRFVRWNQLLEKVTGLAAEMLRGTHALCTIFADDRQFVAGKIREVFEKGLAEVESRFLARTRCESSGSPAGEWMSVRLPTWWEAG